MTKKDSFFKSSLNVWQEIKKKKFSNYIQQFFTFWDETTCSFYGDISTNKTQQNYLIVCLQCTKLVG